MYRLVILVFCPLMWSLASAQDPHFFISVSDLGQSICASNDISFGCEDTSSTTLESNYDDGTYTSFAKSRLGGFSPAPNTVNGAPVRISAAGPDYRGFASASWEETLTFSGVVQGVSDKMQLSISLTGNYRDGSSIQFSTFNQSGNYFVGGNFDALNYDYTFAGNGGAQPGDPVTGPTWLLASDNCTACYGSGTGDWVETGPDVFTGEITLYENYPTAVLSMSLSGNGVFDISNTALLTLTLPEGVTFTSSSGAFMVSDARFTDVPENHWAYAFIEALAASKITSGCDSENYCPQQLVTRAQMAVFLERGINGSGYGPPDASGNVFLDVGAGAFAAAFIEQLASDGITAGCGNGNYCPDAAVTRDQMAVFLLRSKYGADYTPPPATGVFTDVPPGRFAAAWIEKLAADGITAGCGGSNYCPEKPVTRAQMAVFLVRTFGL